MPTYYSFEQLDCWQKCRTVVRTIHKLSAKFPKNETYELVYNMNSAARSSTRNIAEGFGRHHHAENMQFCRISRGSLFEVLDDLITAKDCMYISALEYQAARKETEEAIHSINGYLAYLRSCAKQQ